MTMTLIRQGKQLRIVDSNVVNMEIPVLDMIASCEEVLSSVLAR